jgi:hypothetical protein
MTSATTAAATSSETLAADLYATYCGAMWAWAVDGSGELPGCVGDRSPCWWLLLIAPVGEDLELSAQGADVGADSVELGVPELCPFDVAHARLGDSHRPGYVLLGEATFHPQPNELIDGQVVER